MRQGKIKKIILEKIQEVGTDMIGAFFPKNYPEARLWRELFGLDKNQDISSRRISSVLSKLRREGLVSRKGTTRNSRWGITSKGKQWLHLHPTIDIPKPDGITRLVIFDVPEKYRKKRNRLRGELIAFEFEQLQKSVWIGNRPLPKSFIQLVDSLDLSEAVHIFSVYKEGTLTNILDEKFI